MPRSPKEPNVQSHSGESCTLYPGYSFITPRWLFVIAQATPVELVGDPIIVDETLEAFDPSIVEPGDIVGIGIGTSNCRQGYRIVREAKARGASVIMGGVHATIFPDETDRDGRGLSRDRQWRSLVGGCRTRCSGKVASRRSTSEGGSRVKGLAQARWDLVDPRRYMMPAVQTVAVVGELQLLLRLGVRWPATPSKTDRQDHRRS